MVDDPQEIILEHLRFIRSELADVKKDIRELRDGQLSIRDDIHALRGDVRRQERAIAAIEVDTDRIKARLDLSESPPTI